MDIDINKLKQIISSWADNIPYGMAIFLFGSSLKGKPNPNDIDIAIVFTESIPKSEIGCISVDEASAWEKDLIKKTQLPVSLQVYDPWNPGNLREYLINGPIVLLCLSKAPKNDDRYSDKALDVLLSNE